MEIWKVFLDVVSDGSLEWGRGFGNPETSSMAMEAKRTGSPRTWARHVQGWVGDSGPGPALLPVYVMSFLCLQYKNVFKSRKAIRKTETYNARHIHIYQAKSSTSAVFQNEWPDSLYGNNSVLHRAQNAQLRWLTVPLLRDGWMASIFSNRYPQS